MCAGEPDSRATLAAKLRDAVIAENSKDQEKAYYALDLQISDLPNFDDDCFRVIKSAIENKRVQQSSDSCRLIQIVTHNRDLLSASQSREIADCLATKFPHFGDPAALIVIQEFLVDANTDEGAIELLKNLSQVSNGPAAALIPTGLVYLGERSNTLSVLERIRTIVNGLKKKRGQDLRVEAEMSLRRIDARIAKLRESH